MPDNLVKGLNDRCSLQPMIHHRLELVICRENAAEICAICQLPIFHPLPWRPTSHSNLWMPIGHFKHFYHRLPSIFLSQTYDSLLSMDSFPGDTFCVDVSKALGILESCDYLQTLLWKVFWTIQYPRMTHILCTMEMRLAVSNDSPDWYMVYWD